MHRLVADDASRASHGGDAAREVDGPAVVVASARNDAALGDARAQERKVLPSLLGLRDELEGRVEQGLGVL